MKDSFRDEACEEAPSDAAALRLRRMEAFAAAFRTGLLALCFIAVKFAARDPFGRGIRRRERAYPSQPFSTAQRSRTSGPSAAASNPNGVM
jgi:hypothetical protein